MSFACIATNYENLLTIYPSNGYSKEANEMSRIGNEMESVLSKSMTFDIRYDNILISLIHAFSESALDNWDGYGARATTFNSFIDASKFIKMIPPTFPIPEIDTEPNGGILFEWRKGKKRIFSIIIEGDNNITYAGLFGENKTYGTEYFKNEIPKTILENIQRLFS